MSFRLMRIIDNESSDSECFKVSNKLKNKVVDIIEDCVVYEKDVISTLINQLGDNLEKVDSFLDDEWGVCAENVYPGKGDLWYIFEQTFNAKVSKYGNYLVYPGITVVSHAINREEYRELHNYLKEKIGDYYAILPLESFHVTIHNMFIKRMMKDYYDLLYSKVYPVCKKWNESRGNRTIGARATDVYFRQTVGVMVDLEISGHDLVHEAQHMVRNEAGLKDDGLRFHMTMGYRYNKKEIPKALVEEVVKKIAETLAAHPIVLEEPKVCTFESMMEFEPL